MGGRSRGRRNGHVAALAAAAVAGAAIGALALGLVDSFGDVYLPAGYTNYSILLIFGLLVLMLAIRPQGLLGRPG